MSRIISQPVSRSAFKSFIGFASFLSSGIALAAITSAVIATAALSAFAEPPNRVGRVSLSEGNVSFYMDRSEGWRPARLNYPVTSENSIWTEAASRAEVRIGSSALRLDDNSILDFIRISDDQTQAYLQRGTINIRTRSDRDQNTLSVETGEGRFVVEGNGRYSINASADGQESRFSVYSGRARFESATGGGNSENVITVDRGRTLVVFGDNTGSPRGNTNFRFENAVESSFDRWADARDRSWDQTHARYASSQVISPYMTGYEDLDTYGDWIDNGEYGRIWAPRNVSANWAPYRNGSWSYVNPWGWTWVDDAPWGFAPFHYGRWVTINSRWCWWPGEYNRRPAYAPALVAWYGRPGLSVNVSVGSSVGWFPLAPREYYVPRYTSNATYIRNINYVTNNITVNNYNPPARYQNQVPGATFVNQNVFAQSKPIAANAIRATPAMTTNYVPQQAVDVPRPVMQGQPAIAGAPMQGAKPGSPNSVWSSGRNNVVAPVYAAQPQNQGQSQNQPGQLQTQVPGRVGSGAAIAGAVAAGGAVGAVGAAAIGNNNNSPQVRGRVAGSPQNTFPPPVTPAPMMRGGANNSSPVAPPQPAYLQGAKPTAASSVDLNTQPRVRQNRSADSGDVNADRRNKPQAEHEQQGMTPNQRQAPQGHREWPAARVQPQMPQQPQAPRVPQQSPDQRQVQGQPQQQPQQRAEKQPQAEKPQRVDNKPQNAEKPQNAPRLEGQGKPGQKD